MKIYILKFDGGYQDGDIKGYFSTLKKAQDARKKELADLWSGGTPSDWNIESVNVNQLIKNNYDFS